MKLGCCTKIIARYCGPFEILDRIGLVGYMHALLATIKVHNVFHVSIIVMSPNPTKEHHSAKYLTN
jgi:hypothetical protein